MLSENIKKLVQYGINCGLTPECERIYSQNLLLECFGEDELAEGDVPADGIVLEDVLKELLDEAVSRGIIEDSVVYRDLFDTKLMNCLTPRPAQVIEKFNEDWGTTIVETDGQKYIDYGDDDASPLIPWPEEFKNLLDKKEADFTTVLSLTEFILNKMNEMRRRNKANL